MKKLALLATSAAVLATFSYAKEINVGVVMAMSGPVAAYGQTTYEGIEFANSLQPKLKNGDTIKLILVDNKGDKVETANATTRLISSDKVVGILGALTSTNTTQVMAIAEKKKYSCDCPVATNDKLTENKKICKSCLFYRLVSRRSCRQLCAERFKS